MIEWVVDKPGLRLGLGDSVNYMGDADLVFTHVYGPLPKQLIGKPAIINVFGNKKAKAEEWCGAELHEVSKWAKGLTNTIYVANLDLDVMRSWSQRNLDLTGLEEEEFAPGRGWFPLELALWCLEPWDSHSGQHATVFDGFMGRGTVGKACTKLGLNFIGIDRDPERVAIAREYLGA
jgi:hypothetical protein